MQQQTIKEFFDNTDYLVFRLSVTVGALGVLGLAVWGAMKLFE